MNEPQAEAVAGAIHGCMKDATAHLATKKDLGALESRLEAKISTVESGLEARISALESRLVWRIFLLFTGTAGLAVALLRLFSP